MSIRILIADDHTLMRKGLKNLIAGFADCEVAGDVADGREAVRLARALSPDVVLLDITMPELNGLDACQRILREQPQIKVILLSMHADEDYVLRGITAGAKGYVLKDAAPEELEQALRLVARGGTFLSPQVTGVVVEQLRRGVKDAQEIELSARQREVLQLIAEGHSTRDIAEKLHISVKTVETHRSQVMQKLDVHDVAGLTRYAMRIGLIQPGD
jgi:DNA-binding NarL/FixJ family response regulator